MEFRPCIDIHNGRVKQIVGSSLKDQGSRLYQKDGLCGGHVILLNPPGSAYYEETKSQALSALSAYPGGLQAGGGITPDNAAQFLQAGASHVIVTSYVFKDGKIHYDKLKELVRAVGRKHLVLDLSCRAADGYAVVTDRWQKLTKEYVTPELLDALSAYADEFLIHAADVEGKAAGIETELVKQLGEWGKIPVTYAGGVGSFSDLEALRTYGKNRLHVTIGSALDLFGGPMAYEEVLKCTD